MSAAVVKTSNEGRTGSGTTFTISFGTLPAAGSAIVVKVFGWHLTTPQNFSGVADNQGVGNSYTRDIQTTPPAGGTSVAAIFRCPLIGATGGTFTLTVTMTTGSGAGYAYEVTGLDNPTVTDQSTTTSSATADTSASSGTTAATAQADDIAFAIVANEGNGSVVSTPNATGSNPATGWTSNSESDNSTYQAGSSAWRVLTATGAINHTWTLSTSNTDTAGVIVYKSAAAAAPTAEKGVLAKQGGESTSKPVAAGWI